VLPPKFSKKSPTMRNGTAPQTETSGGSYAISRAGCNVFEDYQKHNSAPQISTELAILTSLRGRYPEYTVNVTPTSTGLLTFAGDGQASAVLDTETESFVAWERTARTAIAPPMSQAS